MSAGPAEMTVPAPDRAARRALDQRVVELPVPLLSGVAVGLVALGAAGALFGGTDATQGPIGLTLTLALAFTPLGVFVLRRLPGHPLGRLMVLTGATAAVATLAVSWSTLPLAAWLSQWMWWPPLALIPILLLLAPDGRLPSTRWRPLVQILLAASALTTVALAGAALARPRTLLSGTAGAVTSPGLHLILVVAVAALGVVLLGTLGVLAALVVRWRGAGEQARHQLACLLPSPAVLALGLTLDTMFDVPYAWLVAVAALPLGLALAVLRYQLHDLDLYVHRGAAWLVLTALAVGIYAVVVAGLGAAFAEPGSRTASVLAAAAVAALLQPAQRLTQRGVNRLLYGRRDEPYSVLTELGHHLEAMRDPLAVLPEIAASIVDGLRVPYAAVRVVDDDGTVATAAERGRWSGEPERFAMVAHGRPVGELLVAPRRPGSRFSAAESRLLRDLAGQTALAAEACRSSVALQRARDRLVLAREEERRRLRRDLHDGVASALVGTRMLTEALRRTVPGGGSAPTLLDALAADLDGCTTEVRTLIDGLRPAALDHGLEPALDGLADRFAGQGPAVTVLVDGPLTELPAAVEVAAYRITAETVTNTVKHAGARTCTITVRRDERHLAVRIDDDGIGFQEAAGGAGVGLSSIRDRAEELGGRATVRSGPAGTTVEVLLPLAA